MTNDQQKLLEAIESIAELVRHTFREFKNEIEREQKHERNIDV
jgi:hypothetical protein